MRPDGCVIFGWGSVAEPIAEQPATNATVAKASARRSAPDGIKLVIAAYVSTEYLLDH